MQSFMFSCSYCISFADTGTPIMEGSFNNTTALPPQEDCQPLTAEEEEIYQELASRISWWFEGLLQCCVGSIGFLANVTFFPPFPLLSTMLRIGAKLGWFVIVDTRPTQADISCKILSSWPQSTR